MTVDFWKEPRDPRFTGRKPGQNQVALGQLKKGGERKTKRTHRAILLIQKNRGQRATRYTEEKGRDGKTGGVCRLRRFVGGGVRERADRVLDCKRKKKKKKKHEGGGSILRKYDLWRGF